MDWLNSRNNRLKFEKMWAFWVIVVPMWLVVLVLVQVHCFCFQKHSIGDMHASNMPHMKNIMCILLNESVIFLEF